MTGELDSKLAKLLLEAPTQTDSKYSRGTLGFVTGSENYPGAALLGINAAFELGIGMVRYLGPKSVTEFILSNRPEVVPGLSKSQALVIGSGVPKDDAGQQQSNIETAVNKGLPMVIDAGAMNLVEYSKLKSLSILTPHHGEAIWLLARFGEQVSRDEVTEKPASIALRLSELTNQIVLLKGNISYLATPGEKVIETAPGSVHLATAGTGDVLAGVIGALMALAITKGIEPSKETLSELALIANSMHSEAAELAAAKGNFGASAVCAELSELRFR